MRVFYAAVEGGQLWGYLTPTVLLSDFLKLVM